MADAYPAVVTTMSAISAVSTGFWSRLSETYGRKPIFIIYLVGTIFGYVDLFSASVNSLKLCSGNLFLH
jgi:MFS family permease